MMGTLTGLIGLAGFPYIASKINRRPILNLSLALVVCPLLYYVGNQLVSHIYYIIIIAHSF